MYKSLPFLLVSCVSDCPRRLSHLIVADTFKSEYCPLRFGLPDQRILWLTRSDRQSARHPTSVVGDLRRGDQARQEVLVPLDLNGVSGSKFLAECAGDGVGSLNQVRPRASPPLSRPS